MPTTEVHAGRDALSLVPGLAALYAGAPVTARPPWLETWAACYAEWDPWVVVVREAGEPVAAAALARQRRRAAGLVDVVALGHGPSDYAVLPARDAQAALALASAVEGALRGLRAPWRLRLQQLVAGVLATTALAARLGHATLTDGEHAPAVEVTERRLGDYLSKNTRKSLARMRNRLDRDGLHPRYEWTTDAARIGALLPDLARVHAERDAHLGRRSDRTRPGAARFHDEVITRLAASGDVRLLTLWLDDRLAAYAVSFADGRALRVWDNKVAPEWLDYSARLARQHRGAALRRGGRRVRRPRLDARRGAVQAAVRDVVAAYRDALRLVLAADQAA